MLIFISGPMTGYPEGNRPAFMELEEKLQAEGHEVINPATILEKIEPIPNWEGCMKIVIPELVKAEAMYVLPDWEESQGARFEVYIAYKLNIPVYTVWVDGPEVTVADL